MSGNSTEGRFNALGDPEQKFSPPSKVLLQEPVVVASSPLFRDRQESVDDLRGQGNPCAAELWVRWQAVSFKEENMKRFGRKLERYLGRGN